MCLQVLSGPGGHRACSEVEEAPGKHVLRGSLTLIPLAVISYVIFHYVNVPPHKFSDSECLECHFTIPQAGETRPYRFIDSIDKLCMRCHEDLKTVSHVVDVAPTMAIPQELPLDESGRITCATCHDPHLPPTDPFTGKKTYFLRDGLVGKAECALCHTTELSAIHQPTHRPAMDRAHGFSSYTVLYPDPPLDSLSIMCIDCHNAPGSFQKTYPGAGIWKHGPDMGLSHPIGTDYRDAAMRDKQLKAMIDLDHRLLFFEGRIGCCTCHDPYRPGGGVDLRIGVKGGFQDLCLACHIK
jgi:predicted CXXCH cytochrome family protein